jgi:hypothetical protein
MFTNADDELEYVTIFAASNEPSLIPDEDHRENDEDDEVFEEDEEDEEDVNSDDNDEDDE